MTTCEARRAIALGLAVVVGSASVAFAQKPAAKAGAATSDEASAKSEALEAARRRSRRAVELLDDLGDRVRDLPQSGTHVRVLACLADALWDYDAERAVRVARRAYDEAETDVDASEADPAAAVRRDRQELVRVVRSHDVALARELAARLARDVPPADPNGGVDKPEDVGRLLAAARDLAPDDPAASAALIRRVLDAGEAPEEIRSALEALKQRAPALAAPLVASAVAILRARGGSPAVLRFVAIPFLFDSNGSAAIDADLLDEEVARTYLEAELAYLTAVATEGEGPSGEAASTAYRDAAWLVAYVDRFDPARSGAVRELAARLRARVSPELAAATDAWLAGDETGAAAHLSEWSAGVASDGREDEHRRDGALWAAATDAAQAGDGATARDLAAKIRDDEVRWDAQNRIAEDGVARAERDGRYDDVRRLASEISDPVRRARALVNAANSELAAGRRERALDLYADMYRHLTAGGTMAATDCAEELMAYARALVPGDPLRALSILGEAAGAANRSKHVGLCRGLCDPKCSNAYSETFSVFATVDFDRAVNVAKSFDDLYLRHYALLGAAVGALRDGPLRAKEPPRRAAQKQPTARRAGTRPHDQY